MVETHEVSNRAAPRPATPENADDVFGEVTEEITALRAIVEAYSHGGGEEYFQALVRHLAGAVDAHYAFVAEFSSPESHARARTIAFWAKDHIGENFEWALAGTPCEDVVRGNLCHHPSGVRRTFPDGRDRSQVGIESYLGVPLRDPAGKVLGHLAVCDDRPMPLEPRKLLTFRIFAAHAAAELVRLRLERQLRESEERLRDLYEEAPLAYVQEDLQSRFIRANRAAQRILGIKPEEVPGIRGAVARARQARRPARCPPAVLFAGSRYGDERCRRRASPQRRRQTDLDRDLGEAGTRRQIHANHVPGRHRPRTDGAGTRPARRRKHLPAGRNQIGSQLRRDRRPKPGAAGRAGKGESRRQNRRDRPHHRGDGDRQGTDRPRDPFRQSPASQAANQG